MSYDAFGNATATGSGDVGSYGWSARYTWTGREIDVETALQYNRARYYDPATGRWITQDPLGFDAGDSNLYRYVRNLPDDGNGSVGIAPICVTVGNRHKTWPIGWLVIPIAIS
jgi:RHS repeat-associated protein